MLTLNFNRDQPMAYKFRNTPGTTCRYSVYVERFITDVGTIPVLEWFKTPEEAQQAVDEMIADGRFHGICSYVRSQETADADFKFAA
jgi:hypothetical protein